MSKLKIAGIIILTAAVGLMGYDYVKLKRRPRPEPIIRYEIVEKTKVKTKYIYVAKTMEDYKMCYQSPIKITASVNNDWLNVIAKDKCKQSERGFKVRATNNWKFYVAVGVGAFALGAIAMNMNR